MKTDMLRDETAALPRGRTRPTRGRGAAGLLLTAWLALFCGAVAADDLVVTDIEDNEIPIRILPADGPFLTIWLTDLTDPNPAFDRVLEAVSAAGIEVWRVDLLDAYFLNRSRELTRQLSGAGVAAVLRAAHERSDKRILLVGYDRLPLPLLRGIHLWQLQWPGPSRLSGAVLFFPNLFGPAPAAGVDPILDPVVSATRVPLFLVQPEHGVLRWRLGELLQAFWDAGTPAYAEVVPGVRDGYLIRDPRPAGPATEAAVARLPARLAAAAHLLASHGAPSPRDLPGVTEIPTGRALGLTPVEPPRPAPGVDAPDARGLRHRLGDYSGKVVLVNFWASWCPPCVDEIPSMNRLASGYDPADFEILSLNFRESPERILAFLRRVEVDFPVLLDPEGRIAERWKVFRFPSSFLLDRRGRIRYSVNSAIGWDEAEPRRLVDALVNEPGPTAGPGPRG